MPYLLLNYHALDCRLHSVCGAVLPSSGVIGEGVTMVPHEPIGCSRLFTARGRWWSAERRSEGVDPEVIPQCDFRSMQKVEPDVEITVSHLVNDCQVWVDQMLEEERALLRFLVAEDSAERGTRGVVGVFQQVLGDIRENFLKPLRGMVHLFGSVIHPIPCLLTQCN